MVEELRRPSRRLGWAVASASAVLAGAWWLHEPAVRYVAICAIATGAALWLATSLPSGGRRLPLGSALAAALFCALAATAQRSLWRIEHRWESYRATVQAAGAERLRVELDAAAASLQRAASQALEAPADAAGAFRALARLNRGPGERGLVLHRGDQPVAWSGRLRVPTDAMRSELDVAFTPFYVAMYAVARSPDDTGRRAVATALLHAEPPADRLVSALDALVASRSMVRGFQFTRPTADLTQTGSFRFAPDPEGRILFGVRPLPLHPGETRLRVVEAARVRGAVALAIALTLFVAAVWVYAASLGARLAALAVALGCIAIVPLSAFSNATRLFDPAIYFAPLGRPFTANIGALGLTSALLLLGLLALLRARVRFPSRWLAGLAVLAIAALGPFLLRDLARGINPPAWGTTIGLWLGWQVTLFLAALSILLAGVSAGRLALGGRRGLPPGLAPLLATVAALLGPLVWTAPSRWPDWYPVLWIASIAALALARPDRRSIVTAAVVAGLGATTLVWGATLRQRVALAREDVAGLETVDPYAEQLLQRFGEQLSMEDTPESRAELLRAYVVSDLAAADYPVALTSWAPGGELLAELHMGGAEPRHDDVAALVAEALTEGSPVLRAVPGVPGTRLLLAVPDENFHVTGVAVEPRTRLIPEDPFSLLMGVVPDPVGEPPYTLAVTRLDTRALATEHPSGWERRGNELHGDWLVQTADGPYRAHVEVELRSLDALIPRGALILLLDLAILAALWGLSASADGGFARWLRSRREQWAHSYRARLTLALFLFFVVPAFLFAAWAYRRLQSDALQSRELLVRETLRAIAGGEDIGELGRVSGRLDAPLLLFEDGMLRASSDELYETLAPTGRFVRPDVYLALGLGDEVTTSRLERIGPLQALFGYRAATDARGERVILAAPAPMNELALGGRRRDLGILVLFATAVGALAALWLSGIAARQLARPIGMLRRAALAIAAGEREPPLALEPPSEFVPVFAAFRRMAADLDASRSALEETQRRIAAILRNVASGVVAIDRDASVTLANPRADALLGTPLPPGTKLEMLQAPALTERVRRFLDATDEDEQEFDLQLEGRQMHVRLTRLTIGRGGAVITVDDVTDLARAQRVLAWGEMARQVAHEIKNPLTPIRLGVQHLRRARSDPRVDYDRVLEQNVSRILSEIDRLDEIARAFSRYGSAPAQHAPTEPTDVARVVRDVVALETMGEGSVAWRVIGADQPVVASARADELREVLLNLLENARLANASQVEVQVARGDGRVRITVEDDGEGIPASVLPKVFEPHFSTRTSGSGLGLAVSRRLIDSWGGAITVASQRGEGTRVEIELPAADGS